MNATRTPSFRKIIVPWYSSTIFYGIVLVVSAMVLVFGITGIFIAKSQPEYNLFYRFPLALSLLGGVLFVINLKRFLSRLIKRLTGEED
ncbi:MAG: hypothetical protein JRE23_02485 [Deltaproteobacteria bacterium]|nr:hypothetical protein [Deltaproteobacteria bacterium]